MTTAKRDWRAICLLCLLAVAATAVIPLLISTGLQNIKINLPEVVLPLLVIAGTIGLLTVLALVVAVFSALGLADSGQALGLPQGTIRAVIGLILILVFVIMAAFLYEQLDETRTQTMEGIPAEYLASIPMEHVVSVRPGAREGQIDILYRVDKPQASTDVAKQVLTTVSTLVVAVTGFYFGTRAVASARGAVLEPTIRVLSPESPAPMPDKGESLVIKIETKPEGESIDWSPLKEEDGTLVQVKPGEFRYAAVEPAPDRVELSFGLQLHPGVPKAILVIEKPKAGEAEGKKAGTGQPGDGGSSIRVLEPSPPVPMPPVGQPLEIELEVKPEGSEVECTVHGDTEESVQKGDKYFYTYTRTDKAEPTVTLTFALEGRPDVTAELVIGE